MVSRTLRPYVLPLAILTAGALIAASALLLGKEAQAVSVPVPLRADGVQTVEFHAAYSKPYVIGIEMDQQAAARLFPCMVDSSSPAFGKCRPAEFPLALSLALVAVGSETQTRISPSSSTAGGRYGGRETFTRDVGYTYLSSGKTYQLKIRSLIDGGTLAATHPRLVIEVHPLDLKGEVLMRGLAVAFAAVLGLVAGIWIATVYLRGLRAARPAGS